MVEVKVSKQAAEVLRWLEEERFDFEQFGLMMTQRHENTALSLSHCSDAMVCRRGHSAAMQIDGIIAEVTKNDDAQFDEGVETLLRESLLPWWV